MQRIKNKLGAKDSRYLRISTVVASEALRRVVTDVNSSQRLYASEAEVDVLGLSYGLTSEQRWKNASKMRKVINDAWDTFKIIDGFDLEAEFKRHYYKNREIIRSMCNNLGISTSRNRSNTDAGGNRWIDPLNPSCGNRSNLDAGENRWIDPLNPSSNDNDSIWWLASIVCCLVGLLIGNAIGEWLGALVGGYFGFCLPWKYKEVSER